MDKLQQIFHLEETIPSERIREYLDFIMNLQYVPEQKTIIFDALFELSDKQWHNYEPLGKDIQVQLEKWMITNCTFNSTKDINTIIGITTRLGLADVLEYLIFKSKDDLLTADIKNELQNGIAEIKDTINDPWSGMR